MKRSKLRQTALTLGFVVLLPVVPGRGQSPVEVPEPEQAAVLTVAEVEANLADLDKASSVDDVVKDVLRTQYQKVIEALAKSNDNQKNAEAYVADREGAPARLEDLRRQLAGLPKVDEVRWEPTAEGVADLQKEVDAKKAELADLKAQYASLVASSQILKNRPGEISAKLPQVGQELAAVSKKLEQSGVVRDPFSSKYVERLWLRARKLQLWNEREMLRLEQLSQALREEVAQAQVRLLERQVDVAEAEFKAMNSAVNRRLVAEAERVVSKADAHPSEIDPNDPMAKELAAEVQGLAREFATVVASLGEISNYSTNLAVRSDALNQKYNSIRSHLKLGGGGVAMARILFDFRGDLPGSSEVKLGLKTWEGRLSSDYLSAFEVERKLKAQAKLVASFGEDPSPGVKRLLATRREVLGKLENQYGNVIRNQAILLGNGREYLDKLNEVRAFLEETLFWSQSSPPLDVATLASVPQAMLWLNRPEHWRVFRDSLWTVFKQRPFAGGLVLLLVGGLLCCRWRLKSLIKRVGEETRRVSSDRYALTLMALGGAVLMSLPVPILLASGGWALGEVPEPSGWLRGMSRGLGFAAWAVLALGFVSEVCRRGGLGSDHFGWPERSLSKVRRTARWLSVFYVLPTVVTASSLFGEASDYFESAGRVCFIFAHLVLAYAYWWLLRFRKGIFSEVIREHPTLPLVRVRYLWFVPAVWLPLSLVVLAAFGYLITAMELGLGLLSASVTIFVGLVLYNVVLRWFLVKERKIALAEALERRRARQEAADSKAADGEPGETVALEPVDEKLALRSISKQTRSLLRFLFFVAILLTVGMLWNQFLPMFSMLEAVSIGEGLTILQISSALMIVIITVMTGRNLPGLLELAVFRALSLDSGTRSAVGTLFQYAVYAVGLAFLFSVLDLDWSKFGWIAAALSVGLGFGLQEVVANFVCGLILLFECPIRVGDVVTVEGMSGTVTRIRMRATTILNWDRQEFVVPNKNIITGTFLNWTLSNQISRVVVSVGVAYGSDTERAREILVEVANDNPLVVEDPAPTASFEEFADSCLTLRLRAYLPNIDNRIRATTELHTEIDRRFKEAGIEISFPQRDLHLRSAGDWVSKLAGGQAK